MSDLSKLCQACGLCCSGAFVTHVQLRAGEAERLTSLSVQVKPRKTGLPILPLGCSALNGTRCGIYDARPQGCRLYVCALGQKLEAGTVSEPEALAVVHQAQALIATVAQQLPAGPADARGPIHQARTEGLREGPQALRDAETFIRAHFHAV